MNLYAAAKTEAINDQDYNRVKTCQDSIKKYVTMDSLIILKANGKQAKAKDFYLAQSFIKARTDNEVNLDTVQYVLTKDFKVVNLQKLQ